MTNFEITDLTLAERPELLPRVREVLARAEARDGVAPLSEAFVNGLSDARLGHAHALIDDHSVAAFAPDGGVELVVDPDFRREGRGSALVRHALDRNAQAQLWTHGNLAGAVALAASFGLSATRELLVMAIDGQALTEASELRVPEGFVAYDYTQAVAEFGESAVQNAWLAVNNDAFSWHPEQGGWDLDQLQRGMEAEWFDSHGVQLLYRGEDLAGFHWTKRHPTGEGEVYVVGLASAFRGQGLGDPLLRMGLHVLVEGGAEKVILYVEADNIPAVRRYEQSGFEVVEKHVVYEQK